MSTVCCCCVIASDHPCLSGHFPNKPIVPGVLIIDRIVTELRYVFGTCGLSNVHSIKFTAPLLPNQNFQLFADSTMMSDANLAIRFRCQRNAVAFAQGKLTLRMP